MFTFHQPKPSTWPDLTSNKVGAWEKGRTGNWWTVPAAAAIPVCFPHTKVKAWLVFLFSNWLRDLSRHGKTPCYFAINHDNAGGRDGQERNGQGQRIHRWRRDDYVGGKILQGWQKIYLRTWSWSFFRTLLSCWRWRIVDPVGRLEWRWLPAVYREKDSEPASIWSGGEWKWLTMSGIGPETQRLKGVFAIPCLHHSV